MLVLAFVSVSSQDQGVNFKQIQIKSGLWCCCLSNRGLDSTSHKLHLIVVRRSPGLGVGLAFRGIFTTLDRARKPDLNLNLTTRAQKSMHDHRNVIKIKAS